MRALALRILGSLLAALAIAGSAPLATAAQPTPDAPSDVAVALALAPIHVQENGLVADFYRPPHAPGRLPAIVLLGGSEGGLNPGMAAFAQLLAARGYAVLQLAYFGAPGLPDKLELVPLEYFGKAIDWLQARPDVDPNRIGLEGGSIGGEVALVVAAHDPRIKAVVAALPSSVVWPGIDPQNPNAPSTFTLAGKPLPDLPYGWTGSFKGVFALYADGLKALDQHPDAIIPVERINGPVMLVCGKSDGLWPSCPMSEQVAARLKATGFAHPVQLHEYDDAGHFSFGPPVPETNPFYAKLGGLGGSPAGNDAARKDDWPRSLAFLDDALKAK